MAPPVLYKKVIKKMAAKGGHIDVMFLAPPPTRPLDPMLKVADFEQNFENRTLVFASQRSFLRKTNKVLCVGCRFCRY